MIGNDHRDRAGMTCTPRRHLAEAFQRPACRVRGFDNVEHDENCTFDRIGTQHHFECISGDRASSRLPCLFTKLKVSAGLLPAIRWSDLQRSLLTVWSTLSNTTRRLVNLYFISQELCAPSSRTAIHMDDVTFVPIQTIYSR